MSLFNLQSLQEHQPAMLYVAQGESSTGLAQPIENLGQLCHKSVTPVNELHFKGCYIRYNCLLIVDTVASLGGLPFFMDKWGMVICLSLSKFG